MVINGEQPAFALGQLVYLTTDQEQLPRMVTAYRVTAREVFYELSWGDSTSLFSEIEISDTKNILL